MKITDYTVLLLPLAMAMTVFAVVYLWSPRHAPGVAYDDPYAENCPACVDCTRCRAHAGHDSICADARQ